MTPPGSIEEAQRLQAELARRVSRAGDPRPITTVAGIDVAYSPETGCSYAAIAVMALPDLTPVEHATACLPTTFPYVPGLFSFRELPPVLEAYRQLIRPPDLLLVDGQGLAHPRRCGLACHLGLTVDRPAIGVAKTRLCGEHAVPGPHRGDFALLVDQGEEVGMALRTQDGGAPLYVSTGHRVALAVCRELVLACTPRFRLSEPLRAADQLTRRMRAAAVAAHRDRLLAP